MLWRGHASTTEWVQKKGWGEGHQKTVVMVLLSSNMKQVIIAAMVIEVAGSIVAVDVVVGSEVVRRTTDSGRTYPQ